MAKETREVKLGQWVLLPLRPRKDAWIAARVVQIEDDGYIWCQIPGFSGRQFEHPDNLGW